MICPHCAIGISESWQPWNRGEGPAVVQLAPYEWYTAAEMTCPECDRVIIALLHATDYTGTNHYLHSHKLLYPANQSGSRQPPPKDVPAHLAEDYREACQVFSDSPKASAALSRRCLQSMLRENGFEAKTLDAEIQKTIESRALPTAVVDALDAVRVIGNFAAHPIKSTASGEIIEVEPGEAEWLLDTLEALFDVFYVQPAAIARKREALNAKLAAAGKPPLK